METLAQETGLPPDQQALIVAHYRAITPLLNGVLGPIPLMYTTFPDGLGDVRVFHHYLDDAPAAIATVQFTSAGAGHRAAQLSVHNIDWLINDRAAVELETWAPLPTAADHAAFVRLTLEPSGSAGFAEVTAAAALVRGYLQSRGLDAIPLLDGLRGMALWIPCADPKDIHASTTAPSYPAIRAWASELVSTLIASHPKRITNALLRGDRGDRVCIGVHGNTVGLSSALPYSLRGLPHLPVCLPITWDDLGKRRNGDVTAENFAVDFAARGDIFGPQYEKLRTQTLPAVLIPVSDQMPLVTDRTGTTVSQGHNYLIEAAVQMLADGASRTIDELLESGLQAKLLPAHFSRRCLYSTLHDYRIRSIGVGRTPAIVEVDADHFQLQRPVDDWPVITLPPTPSWIAPTALTDLKKGLAQTAVGTDPAAFEMAVCAAFAALGFSARHIGGNGQPDGTLDAPLGREGYRVVIECKTAAADTPVKNPRPAEPDGFRTQYQAQYAIVIGPQFGDERSLSAELQTYRVALWTVDDLQTALTQAIGPGEMLPAFAPGHAAGGIAAILWERDHGRRKRVAVIADLLARAGWQAQHAFGMNTPDAERPELTVDTLMFLVDQALSNSGTIDGPTQSEFHDALALCVALGTLHAGKFGGGYVAGSPPPPEPTPT